MKYYLWLRKGEKIGEGNVISEKEIKAGAFLPGTEDEEEIDIEKGDYVIEIALGKKCSLTRPSIIELKEIK